MDLKISTIEELKDSCIGHLRAVSNDMITLQADRAKAFDAFLSKPYGNEIDGRSKFVTSDLSDVVESIMPSLMKVFYGNKNVASILPVGQEDEQSSKLVEELVNWQFTTQMNGYKILDTWFRDSLYQKLGVIKYYWLEEELYKPKEYEGLTESEYLKILQQVDAGTFIIDKEAVSTEEDAEYDEYGQTVKPATVTYEVEGRKITKVSRPHVENIPPEEFIFDIHAKSVEDMSFCAHKKRVHKTYLLKYKVKDTDIANEIDSFQNDTLYLTRFADLGGIRFFQDPENPDFLYIYECYLDSYDKKGKKTPMKLLVMGNSVIDAEENKYGKAPFCTLCPLPVPHRMVGRDFADMVRPIQELHTYYMRYINDNLAFQNNGMRILDPFKIDPMQFIKENVPGGLIMMKQPGEPSRAIHNITPTPLAPEVYGLIEQMDIIRQERTGVTKYQSGMDSKSLNRTASGISQIMGAAQQRVELLARTYAETGIKDLFQALVDMNLDFFNAAVNVRINKQWAEITPDMIDGTYDIMVDVGASMGTAEIKVQQMLQALNTYSMVKQGGTPIPAKYEYAILQELWSQWGYKNVDAYAPGVETIIPDMQEQNQALQAIAPPMPQEMPPTPPEEPGLEVPQQKLTPELIRQELMLRGIING